ncbi:MAG: glutamate acetyltransferase [Goleter apudmare HA4340-LM2]|nr:glutamate acetyltransferase [Goleter apudmare HA4340-LM2]
MHHILQVSKYTAIRQLVYSHLLSAISINTAYQTTVRTSGKKIPLHQGRDEKKILYISGVALWLTKSQNQKPMEIANAIASHLLATCGDVFSIQIVPPGWIHLELTHPAIATWLQNITVGSMGERNNISNPQSTTCNSESLFFVQYAHARCSSLLLLAHREGLITFREPLPNTIPYFKNLIFPNSIPWLDAENKLRLNHSAEGRLITELVQIVDNLESHAHNSAVNWQKAALNLSQAFDTFWRQCRIWGEVKINSPQLAQARLGLIMVTQSILRFLLEEKLGILAPSEL